VSIGMKRFLFLVLLMAMPAGAAESYRFAAVPPHHLSELRCGTNEFPPFTYADDAGRAVGIEVEVMQELAKRLGLNIHISVLPWPRMLSMIRSGELDCMFAAFYTEERNTYMQYTQVPIHVSRLAVYTHRSGIFPLARLEDLRGKRIGLIRDFRTVPALDEALERGDFAEVVLGTSFRNLFDQLAAGRIDVVIVNHHVGEHILRLMSAHDIVELPHALSSNSAFITFTRQRKFDMLIPKINYALFEIISDGTYSKIFSRHMAPTPRGALPGR
jgi:ABC-type amino acid transport substrate-binding protein